MQFDAEDLATEPRPAVSVCEGRDPGTFDLLQIGDDVLASTSAPTAAQGL